MRLDYKSDTQQTPELTSCRHQILRLLLENREGLCIENLASKLNITRTATQQHFKNLEKEGLIQKVGQIKTSGRPSTRYTLTNTGVDYFPKHYLALSTLLLQSLKEEMGSEKLASYLKKLGIKLASNYRSEFAEKSGPERLELLASLMRRLGFHASIDSTGNSQDTEIQAYNCIYHHAAKQFPEICELDLAFIGNVLDDTGKTDIKLDSCIVQGDGLCCFKIHRNV
jgi:DeoR family transcriptional regulator, suf operon transcriptional repressor